jgi:hypothetical protein
MRNIHIQLEIHPLCHFDTGPNLSIPIKDRTVLYRCAQLLQQFLLGKNRDLDKSQVFSLQLSFSL